METIKTRFEAKFLMRDISNNKVTNQVVTLGTDIEAFIAQELTLLAQQVDKMKIQKPTCSCRTYAFGEHNCEFTSNDAITDAVAIIRAHVKDLEV